MKCIIPITANGTTVRHECHASNQSVKLTKENVMIKARDTWTMEITFPLSVRENMEVFGHVNRIDVTRRKARFQGCALYAGNELVIAGTGTVTYISDKEVRLQILAGKEEYRYREEFANTYIDRLDYEVPIEFFGQYPKKVTSDGYLRADFERMGEELLPYCCFATIADANGTGVMNKPSFSDHGARVSMLNCALQPNLWFVATTCLKTLGYDLRLSWMEYDVPSSSARTVQSEAYRLFTHIYICNTRRNRGDIARALPHWTVEKFLQEVENLFNVTFVFSPDSRTATVIDNSGMDREAVAVECCDDFTAEYDDDGIKLVGASNLAYNLSGVHESYEDVSDEILGRFEVLEFDSDTAAIASWTAMQADEQSVMTRIWKTPTGYFYTLKNEDNGVVTFTRAEAGQLQHLTRDVGSDDNTVTLNISPVAMVPTEYMVNENMIADWIPHVDSEVVEGEDADYYSVEMAIEGESDPEEEVAERMEVFTLGSPVEFLYFENQNGQRKLNRRFAVTHAKSQPWYDNPNSLSIDRDRVSSTIGSLHSAVSLAESHIRHTIRFVCQGMPDPKKIYMIRGKRFLCEKIEVEIKDDKIQDLKTGYFFEML